MEKHKSLNQLMKIAKKHAIAIADDTTCHHEVVVVLAMVNSSINAAHNASFSKIMNEPANQHLKQMDDIPPASRGVS